MNFIKFIVNPFNRKVLLGLVIFHTLVALALHWAYPFTIYFHDSPGYFQAAKMKMFTGYRPYGYSGFINFCISFNKSIYTIIFFQSLLYLIANIVFIFSIDYIYPFFKKRNFIIFAALISFATQQFYLSNVLISDSIFISLTLLWIACILHILNNEKINYFQVILYALICYAAAKVRYAGLIYPFIGLGVMAFFFRKSYGKLLLNAAVSLLVFFFIYKQGIKENRDLCGIETFSAFSGWARLNNAAISLPKEGKEIKEKKFAEIHSFFKSFPDSMYNAKKIFTGELIWNKSYPEKMYLQAKLQANPSYPYFFRYVALGKVYNDYAGYLIKNNFGYFITHFYLPNMSSVIFPTVDDITEYLYRPVDESTQIVCDTKFTKFIPRVDVYKDWFSGWVGLKYTLYTLIFIASLIYFLGFKRLKLPKNYTVVIYFMSMFLIGNSLFLAYAHPIVLRYIISNEFLFVTVVLILFDQYSKLKETDKGLGVKNEGK